LRCVPLLSLVGTRRYRSCLHSCGLYKPAQ
jgi:hypothetical protein